MKIFLFFFLILFSLPKNADDYSLKLLDLKKTAVYLKETKSSYERALHLKEMGLISEESFRKSEAEYLKASIEFKKSLISFVGADINITLNSATKWIDKSGKPHVTLDLSFFSRNIDDLKGLEVTEDVLNFEFLSEIRNIRISLLSSGIIVSYPYEIIIEKMKLGEAKKVDFVLLKELEDLEILMNYAGNEYRKKVFLIKESEKDFVKITPQQFSQESELGSEVSYDLTLERFSSSGANSYLLKIIDLPEEISYYFIDNRSNSRISLLSFLSDVNSAKISLKLFLPKDQTNKVKADEAIRFHIFCINSGLSPEKNQEMKFLEEKAAGKVELELIPRGSGKIDLSLPNLYFKLEKGSSLESECRLKNSGSSVLNNVKLIIEAPQNWRIKILPDQIDKLLPTQESFLKMTITPSSDVVEGEYELKIKAESFFQGKKVNSPERLVRLTISTKSNIFITLFLITFLVLIILLSIWYGIKLTKR